MPLVLESTMASVSTSCTSSETSNEDKKEETPNRKSPCLWDSSSTPSDTVNHEDEDRERIGSMRDIRNISGDQEKKSVQQEDGVQTAAVQDGPRSSQSRLVHTALVCLSCVLLGMYTNILGPSLLHVENFTGSNTKTVSALFIWRNCGYLLGSLLAGPLLDRCDEYFLVSASFAAMMAAVAVSPWWPELVVLGVMFIVGGVANGICVVSLVSAILTLWGARSGPFQQAAFFSLSIGTALCPQVFKGFSGERDTTTNSQISQDLYLNCTTESSQEINDTVATPNNGSVADTDGSISTQTAGLILQYGYLLIALSLLSGCIINSGILWYNGLKFRKLPKSPQCRSLASGKHLIEGVPKMVVLMLLFTLGFIMAAVEETFCGLIITFLVKHLGWGDKVAADMITVYLVTSATSRGLGIIVARVTQASKALGMQVLLVLIGYLLLTFGLYSHWVVPWLSAAFIGLGFGGFYPVLINWQNSCMELHGKETSVIFISISTGKMISPYFVGYLFEEHNPMWFVHVGLIYAVLLVCMYAIKYAVVSYFMKRVKCKYSSIQTGDGKYVNEEDA